MKKIKKVRFIWCCGWLLYFKSCQARATYPADSLPGIAPDFSFACRCMRNIYFILLFRRPSQILLNWRSRRRATGRNSRGRTRKRCRPQVRDPVSESSCVFYSMRSLIEIDQNMQTNMKSLDEPDVKSAEQQWTWCDSLLHDIMPVHALASSDLMFLQDTWWQRCQSQSCLQCHKRRSSFRCLCWKDPLDLPPLNCAEWAHKVQLPEVHQGARAAMFWKCRMRPSLRRSSASRSRRSEC